MKVDFIILSAQKCATTTLFRILTGHPRVVGSRRKEPHFFSTSPDWRGELPRYEALFEPREGALYCEASTSYTFYPHRRLEIWRDLADYNPDLKFIYLVRNPVDRIVSSYMDGVARGYTRMPIDRAIRINRLLLDVSRYHTQVSPYVRQFGRDRVLLLDFADLVGDRRASLRRVAQFLGISFAELCAFDGIHANPSTGRRRSPPWIATLGRVIPPLRKWMPARSQRPELPPATRRMIIRMLELEIDALEKLMHKDLSAWRCADVGGPSDMAAPDPSTPGVRAAAGLSTTAGGAR